MNEILERLTRLVQQTTAAIEMIKSEQMRYSEPAKTTEATMEIGDFIVTDRKALPIIIQPYGQSIQ